MTQKAQVALEFLIVYSFVLIVFILLFSLVASQRSASLVQQQYSLLQLQAQNIASYINQALSAGNGYYTVFPLATGIGTNYNVSISSSGVVIVQTKVGTEVLTAYAFSNARQFTINGTLESSSTNTIQIYQISTQRGSISLGNSNGKIVVDEYASRGQASFGVLAPYITQLANTKAAQFNDSQSLSANTLNMITVPNSQYITLGNNFAVSFWVDPTAERKSCGSVIGKSVRSQAGQFEIYVEGDGTSCATGKFNNNELVFSYIDTNGQSHTLNSNELPSDTWTYAVAVFNGGTGTMTWYLNGTKSEQYSGLGSIAADSNALYIGGDTAFFNGSISNVQLYNGILSSNQVQNLYSIGISSSPISSNIIGWWPLNGNLNDYSGYNDYGFPTNNCIANSINRFSCLNYDDVAQYNLKFLGQSGSLIANKLVGIETTIGNLGYNGSSLVTYTNSNGIINFFITSNYTLGSGYFAADYFNLFKQPGNVIGWWPLDTGSGNSICQCKWTVFDLINYTNGKFINGGWKTLKSTSTTSFLVANFPGDLGNVGGSNTEDGFITVNSSPSLLNLATNDSFTVVSWIDYGGNTPLHNQGIFGNWNGGSGGFQLEGYNQNSVALYVASYPVIFPNNNQSFPSGKWFMVTAEYNGTTGLASLYLNNSLYASNTLPKQLSLVQNTPLQLPYYIGDDAYSTTGLDTFNGSMANIQLYSLPLRAAQINNLYNLGLPSIPLDNAGLVGWWPLSNTSEDYSYNNNTGTIKYNVSFISSALPVVSNSSVTGASTYAFGYPNLNGTDYITIPYKNYLDLSAPFSIGFTFVSSNAYTVNFVSDLFNSTTSTNGGIDLQLCGGGALGPCGFTGIRGIAENGAGGTVSSDTDYAFNFTPGAAYTVLETLNQTKWTIYVDGQLGATGSLSGTATLLAPSANIILGGKLNKVRFSGSIYNLQIYNTALPSSLVATYNNAQVVRNIYNVSLG